MSNDPFSTDTEHEAEWKDLNRTLRHRIRTKPLAKDLPQEENELRRVRDLVGATGDELVKAAVKADLEAGTLQRQRKLKRLLPDDASALRLDLDELVRLWD